MATGGNNTIDIAATFQALYGYVPAQIPLMPAAPVSGNPYSMTNTVVKKTATATGSALYGLSDTIGRPVFMPITLTANQTDYNFPFCTISISNKKILKQTPMVDRGGYVIEEVSLGAWEMDLKGFFIDPDNQFPDGPLTSLYNLYAAKVSVSLKCALTDLFLGGNTNVVITELDIPAKAKVIGVRDFSFKMVQDSILYLYNTSNN